MLVSQRLKHAVLCDPIRVHHGYLADSACDFFVGFLLCLEGKKSGDSKGDVPGPSGVTKVKQGHDTASGAEKNKRGSESGLGSECGCSFVLAAVCLMKLVAWVHCQPLLLPLLGVWGGGTESLAWIELVLNGHVSNK